jgi:hypothetical protein
VTIDEAATILKTKRGSMHDFAAAGAFVVSYYNANRHLTRSMKGGIAVNDSRRFTTDATPRRRQFTDAESRQGGRDLLRIAREIQAEARAKQPHRTRDQVVADEIKRDANWCRGQLISINEFNRRRWGRTT